MESFRALYRLVVMAGTLVVLGMAFIAYGPPAEEVGPMLGRASDYVRESITQWQAKSQEGVAEPPQLALTPLAEGHATTAFPPVQLQSAPQLVRTTAAPNIEALPPDDLNSLISELNSLGMGAHKLARWGSTGELYRFTCRVAYPAQAALEQHFEAVADQPATAVASVLHQVRALRNLN